MLKVFFLGLFLFQSVSYADNHLLLLGGSGDPSEKQKTIFDSTAEKLSVFTQTKNFSSTVAFNGSHPETEKTLQQIFPGSSKFNSDQFKSIVNYFGSSSFVNNFEKSFSKDDKVLIFINSHGFSVNGAQSSHHVACGDTKCNLDDLNTLIQRLEGQGTQVALIDASCYSGDSLKLGTSNTCVMSSTRADSVGYTKTNELYAEELNNPANKNLEDVFLNTHEKYFGQGNINSPAGTKTRALLDRFFKEFKNPFPQGGSFPVNDCLFNESLSLKNLKDLQKEFTQIASETEPEFKQLKEAIKDYNKRLKRAQELSVSTKKMDATVADPTDPYLTWATLVNFSQDKRTEQITQLSEELKVTSNAVAKQEISEQISHIQSFEQLKARLRQTNPEFEKYEKEAQELNTLLHADIHNIPDGSLIMAQFNILKPEQTLYRKVYQHYKGPNPCSSFSL